MKTVAVAREEGGEWLAFEKEWEHYDLRGTRGVGGTVHAIKFDNGMVWDAVNGFRGIRHPMRVVVRVPMGRRRLRKRRTPDGDFKWAP